MGTGTRTATILTALALVAAGCSSGADDSGGGNRRHVADRVDHRGRQPTGSRRRRRWPRSSPPKTGIKVNIVAVAEDQFDQPITSAAAAGHAAGRGRRAAAVRVRTLASGDLLDTDTAKQGRRTTSAPDTFAPAASN